VRIAIVEVALTDGTHLTERVEAVRGTPRNPMSRAEVVDKSKDLIAPVIGPETSTRLIATVFAIEAMTDIRRLRPFLQRG
jgi:2-methylcitrate dehydratase PrpD